MTLVNSLAQRGSIVSQGSQEDQDQEYPSQESSTQTLDSLTSILTTFVGKKTGEIPTTKHLDFLFLSYLGYLASHLMFVKLSKCQLFDDLESKSPYFLVVSSTNLTKVMIIFRLCVFNECRWHVTICDNVLWLLAEWNQCMNIQWPELLLLTRDISHRSSDTATTRVSTATISTDRYPSWRELWPE